MKIQEGNIEVKNLKERHIMHFAQSTRDAIKEIIKNLDKACDSENERILWDKSLDLLETIVRSTTTKFDDWIILPLISLVRKRFNLVD